MSILNDKINSYALERGIEFNQAYPTVSPYIGARTGTNPFGTYNKNTTGNIVWEPTVGPLGGAGSWKLQWSTTTATNSYVRGTVATNTELLGIADGNWSMGFWFKINNIPATTSSAAASLLLFHETVGGFTLSVAGTTTPGVKANLTIAKSGYGQITQLVPGGIDTETWYYFAFTREGSTHKIYLNNVMVFSFGNSGVAPTTGALMWGDTSARTFTGSWNISNYYFAPATVIGPTEIAEIWTAGSTTPPAVQNLTYWDGTNWTVPTNKYQWDGINWVTFNGQYWNGSAWVNIT